MPASQLAGAIDHTALKPETTPADADRLVREAVEHGFASVCVNGRLLENVRAAIDAAGAQRRVGACAVAAFPLGAHTPTALAMEATLLAKAGADEIDAVAWLPTLLAIDAPGAAEAAGARALRDHLLPMIRASRAANPRVVIKIILETAALRAACADGAGGAARFEAMISAACLAARESGCDFVKTSTGFHAAGGATIEAVSLLKKHAGAMRVKASGGIRTRDDALRMIDAGASRIGTSAGVAIARGDSGPSRGY